MLLKVGIFQFVLGLVITVVGYSLPIGKPNLKVGFKFCQSLKYSIRSSIFKPPDSHRLRIRHSIFHWSLFDIMVWNVCESSPSEAATLE